MTHAPTQIKIVRAREENLASINALIARSKSHWDWPEDYLREALPVLRLTPDTLRGKHCFEVLAAHGELVAFVSVKESPEKVLLDDLWVVPEVIGHGVGRQACEHVFQLARQRGWRELWVLPDPYSEGFYVKVGFSDTGERVPSRVPSGPMFSVYRIRFDCDAPAALL